MNREEIIAAATTASPNSNPIVETSEDILLTRCLNDKNGDAIARYENVLTKLVSPTKRKISAAILTLHYDGQSTNLWPSSVTFKDAESWMKLASSL